MAFTRANAFAGFHFADAPRYDAASRRAALDRLDVLATVFDTAFILPGTNIRFGVESLLRLVPGIGDAVASVLSCYLLYEARRLGVPRLLFARMVANVLARRRDRRGAGRRRCVRRVLPRQSPQCRAIAPAFRPGRILIGLPPSEAASQASLEV